MGGKCVKDSKIVNYGHANFKEANKINVNLNCNVSKQSISKKNFEKIDKNSTNHHKNLSANKINSLLISRVDSIKNKDERRLTNQLSTNTLNNSKIISDNTTVDVKKESSKIQDKNLINDNISVNSKALKNNEAIKSGEGKTFKVLKNINKENEDLRLIEICINQHFFMKALDKNLKSEIIKEMTLYKVNKGDVIFNQGSIGNFFYIIKNGQIQLSVDQKPIKYLGRGDSFGELALLHGCARSASVCAITDCLLWLLERNKFREVVVSINSNNFEENKKFIQTILILQNLENDQKTILCSNLIKFQYEPGSLIVKQGDAANCLYIVKEGEVECKLNTKVCRTLSQGDHFGERGILLDSTRTMDVVAKNKCICYSISIQTLKSILGDSYREVLYLNFMTKAFFSSKYLKNLNRELIESIYNLFKPINYQKRDIVLNKGYLLSSKLIIIIDGSLIKKNNKERVGTRGAILFEDEIVNSSNKTLDDLILAHPDCLLLQAERDLITQRLGSSLYDLSYKSLFLEFLSKIPLFKSFSLKKLESLKELMGFEKYPNNSVIISQGDQGSRFFMVKSGKVDIIIDGNYIRSLNEKQYFGERALFFQESRTATAIANGEVELFYLEKEDFLSILENNMREYLMKKLNLQDDSIELNDLEYIKPLGSGNYGEVSLVICRKNKFRYAIKGISKAKIDTEKLHRNLELEKSILLQIDHPFIVKLVKTIKNKTHIFFLMEYIQGKELFDVIREIGILNRYQTQFFGAAMMLAVEYLHEKKFIYRDIKPENIIVIESGYPKLIDFGSVKKIVDRTSTIIGTPHYMAPEVIIGEGYSFAVDYWSIAICLYEFMCGRVPFAETAEDPMDVYLTIINDELVFPTLCTDKEFKSFIANMLEKNQINRLYKLSQIKQNNWFKDFNWENLIFLNAKPAFIPYVPEDDFANLNKIPFITYVQNNLNENTQIPYSTIDAKLKIEYDKWFNKF